MIFSDADYLIARHVVDKLVRARGQSTMIELVASALADQKKRDAKVAREHSDLCSCANAIANAILKSGI